VFDAYRPQRAVDHFIRWAHDSADTRTKAEYYPNLNKEEIFPNGYLVELSSHSRGSTVDLTLIDCYTYEELDMGTPFDFFDLMSWPASLQVTPQQRANRLLLRSIMGKHGFVPVEEEWWHFTLKDEPYPDRYFDFPIR
jgi:D-alanyl-D-alanine dipeptidase